MKARECREGNVAENFREKYGRFLNINTLLIAANVAVWLALSAKGDTRDADFMLRHGAMYPWNVLNGEWWRLASSMFLHFGAEHLLCNMFMQYFLGDMLLRALEQWKYALVYLLSGLCGSAASLYMMLKTGDWSVSAGASGSIYGVIGGLLWVVLRSRGRFQSISVPRMLLATTLYVSYGFTTEGVDAWAHLGGAVAGFFITAAAYRGKTAGEVR